MGDGPGSPSQASQQNLSAVTPTLCHEQGQFLSPRMGKSLLLFSFDTDYLAFSRDHLHEFTPRHIADGPDSPGHSTGSKLMLESCAALTLALLSDPNTPSFSMDLVGGASRMWDACPASPTAPPAARGVGIRPSGSQILSRKQPAAALLPCTISAFT